MDYIKKSFTNKNKDKDTGQKAIFGIGLGLTGVGAGILGYAVGYGGYKTYQWFKNKYFTTHNRGDVGPTDDEWKDKIKKTGIELDPKGDDLFSKINKNIQISTEDLNLAKQGKYAMRNAAAGDIIEQDLEKADIPETISRAQNNQDFYLKLRKGLYKLSDENLIKAYKIAKPAMTEDQSRIRAEDIFTDPPQFRDRINISQSDIDNHIQSVLSNHDTDGNRISDATSIQNPLYETNSSFSDVDRYVGDVLY